MIQAMLFLWDLLRYNKKMKPQFYSTIIDIEPLFLAIGQVDLSADEKAHLLALVDSNIHSAILDAVLTELSEKDKKTLLGYLLSDDHEKIWEHLNKNIQHVEEKIKKTVAELSKQLHQDIEEAKRKSSPVE